MPWWGHFLWTSLQHTCVHLLEHSQSWSPSWSPRTSKYWLATLKSLLFFFPKEELEWIRPAASIHEIIAQTDCKAAIEGAQRYWNSRSQLKSLCCLILEGGNGRSSGQRVAAMRKQSNHRNGHKQIHPYVPSNSRLLILDHWTAHEEN